MVTRLIRYTHRELIISVNPVSWQREAPLVIRFRGDQRREYFAIMGHFDRHLIHI